MTVAEVDEQIRPATFMEIQQAITTARRIVGKSVKGSGHYPGSLEQLNLARCFLALMERPK